MVRSLVAAAMLAAVPAQAFAPGGLVPLRAGLVSPASASSPVQPGVIPALPRRSLSACARVPSPRAGTSLGCDRAAQQIARVLTRAAVVVRLVLILSHAATVVLVASARDGRVEMGHRQPLRLNQSCAGAQPRQ